MYDDVTLCMMEGSGLGLRGFRESALVLRTGLYSIIEYE
jgi:hypothetical protein